MYEIELPENVNTKKVNEVLNITLTATEGELLDTLKIQAEEGEEQVTEENLNTDVQNQEIEQPVQENETEKQDEQEIQEETQLEEEILVSENGNLEIVENKLYLKREQIDNMILNCNKSSSRRRGIVRCNIR